MAFKEDWSFLDKITMGAVGTESVITQLNAYGHQVIELERYCTSNKIWATKIKRLRIPDLLCLRCGKRIESRAKSKLGIITIPQILTIRFAIRILKQVRWNCATVVFCP